MDAIDADAGEKSLCLLFCLPLKEGEKKDTGISERTFLISFSSGECLICSGRVLGLRPVAATTTGLVPEEYRRSSPSQTLW